MSEPTDEELLQGLEDMEADDEVAKIAAMSPDQVRAELRAAGVNLEAEHAKLEALQASVEGKAVPNASGQGAASVARVVPLSRKRYRWQPYFAIAAAFVLAGLGGVVAPAMRLLGVSGVGTAHVLSPWTPAPFTPVVQPILFQAAPPVPPPIDASVVRARLAAEFRARAFAECDQGQWRECLGDFDLAQYRDPEGDLAPRVRAYRRRAAAHRAHEQVH